MANNADPDQLASSESKYLIYFEWFGICDGQNLLTFQRVATLVYRQNVVSAKYL